MSNIFTKSNLGLKIQGLDSETSADLHTFLQSSDKKGGSSKFSMTDDTSSFMPQKGGSTNKKSNDQVEQLISMLTSETEDKHNATTNSTSTSELEIKLRNVLQNGGIPITKHGTLEQNVTEARKKVNELNENVKNNTKSVEARARLTKEQTTEYAGKLSKSEATLENAKKVLTAAEAELKNYKSNEQATQLGWGDTAKVFANMLFGNTTKNTNTTPNTTTTDLPTNTTNTPK